MPYFLRNAFAFTKENSTDKNLSFEYIDFVNNNCLLIVKYLSIPLLGPKEINTYKRSSIKVKDTNVFNFLVKKNEDNQTYELYSNVYLDLTDKFLRIDVANKILQYV